MTSAEFSPLDMTWGKKKKKKKKQEEEEEEKHEP